MDDRIFDGLKFPISTKPFWILIIAIFIYALSIKIILRKLPRSMARPLGSLGGVAIIGIWFWYMFYR